MDRKKLILITIFIINEIYGKYLLVKLRDKGKVKQKKPCKKMFME